MTPLLGYGVLIGVVLLWMYYEVRLYRRSRKDDADGYKGVAVPRYVGASALGRTLRRSNVRQLDARAQGRHERAMAAADATAETGSRDDDEQSGYRTTTLTFPPKGDSAA